MRDVPRGVYPRPRQSMAAWLRVAVLDRHINTFSFPTNNKRVAPPQRTALSTTSLRASLDRFGDLWPEIMPPSFRPRTHKSFPGDGSPVDCGVVGGVLSDAP